jgi:hypothetical protein
MCGWWLGWWCFLMGCYRAAACWLIGNFQYSGWYWCLMWVGLGLGDCIYVLKYIIGAWLLRHLEPVHLYSSGWSLLFNRHFFWPMWYINVMHGGPGKVMPVGLNNPACSTCMLIPNFPFLLSYQTSLFLSLLIELIHIILIVKFPLWVSTSVFFSPWCPSTMGAQGRECSKLQLESVFHLVNLAVQEHYVAVIWPKW